MLLPIILFTYSVVRILLAYHLSQQLWVEPSDQSFVSVPKDAKTALIAAFINVIKLYDEDRYSCKNLQFVFIGLGLRELALPSIPVRSEWFWGQRSNERISKCQGKFNGSRQGCQGVLSTSFTQVSARKPSNEFLCNRRLNFSQVHIQMVSLKSVRWFQPKPDIACPYNDRPHLFQ